MTDDIPSARDEKVKRLLGFLRQDPGNWALRADLFDAALERGDREVARSLLEESQRLRPDDPGWVHRRAVMALAEARYPEAENLLRTLVDAGHGVPAVRHNLGFALFGQGRWEEAREAVTGLLEASQEADRTPAIVLWLRCCHRLDRLDEGLERLRALAAQGPVGAEAWGVASLLAIDAGRMEEAKEWSDRALAGRPDQMEALAARASLKLGELDATGSRSWFEQALRQNGGDGRSWSGLAFSKMLAGDLRGAEEAFDRAVAAMPEHVGTWIGLGWCQVLSQRAQAARHTFERALAVDRNVAEAHGGLAVALARMGDAAAARSEIEVALRLDRMSLSARYAEAVLSGEAENPAAFQRMARRLLAQHPAGGRARPGQTMADVVFGTKRG